MHRIFKYAQGILPPISPTERIALSSGKQSIEASIFRGRTSPWLHQLDLPRVSQRAEEVIQRHVRPLCDTLNNYEDRRAGGLSSSAMDLCRPLFGLGLPEAHGGLGLNRHDQSQIVQMIASKSVDGGVTVMVPNSLGPAELIHHYGTDHQQDTYLPKLTSGESIPCFGLTGTFSGSDAASMMDRGRVFSKEDGSLHIRLNCEKRYITLAPIADLIGVAFVLEDPHQLLEDPDQTGITLALLERDTPGLHIGDRHMPLNATFYNGPFSCDEVTIPIEQVVGGKQGLGQGWKMLMECLVEGRGISLPASALASMKTASLYVGAYTQLRKQFRIPLARMEAIQEHMAEMVYHTYTSTASQFLYNGLADDYRISSTLSAILKYTTTERARKTVNHGMDVVAGMGICDGKHNVMSGLYGALPVSITVEGSNTLTRSLMIYGQGLLRGHPHMQDLQNSLESDDPSAFYTSLLRTIWDTTGCTLHSTVENILCPEHPLLSLDYRIARLLRRFQTAANLGLPAAPSLKASQVYSGAMADALIAIYEVLAVEWFYRSRVKEGKTDAYENEVQAYAKERLLMEANAALGKASSSLKHPVHGWLVHATTQPWGFFRYTPGLSVMKKVALSLSHSDALRDILAQGIDMDHPALKDLVEAWDLHKKGDELGTDRLYQLMSVDRHPFDLEAWRASTPKPE